MNRILLVQCPDAIGLIHTITGFLVKADANILSNHEFVDPLDKVFFMRTEFSGGYDSKSMEKDLLDRLPKSTVLSISGLEPKKVIVMGTKEPHCLGDLLLRSKFHELSIEIVAVVCNHLELQSLVENFGIPFHFISHEGISKEEHESKILQVLSSYSFSHLLLAKYMRILSASFLQKISQKILNIHHSFLPAFVGAKPYKQAYERGVKIIGATAHFVTEDLDEGPILVQDVLPVDHADTPNRLVLFGKDLEKSVFGKAVRLLVEERVIIYKNRTIVFD